jgi:hypothetical protein
MKTFVIGMVLSLPFVIGGTAQAQTFTAGPGTATCAQFGEKYASNTLKEFNYFYWAQGWLSGLNSVEGSKCGRSRALRDLFSIPVERQMATIRQYCNEKPLAQYTQAVAFMRDNYLKKISLPPLPASSCLGQP